MTDAPHMEPTTRYETLVQAEQLIESVYRDIEGEQDPEPESEDPRMERLRKAAYEVRKAIEELDKAIPG